MGKKKIKLISGIVAAALACSVGFGGCSLISTDNAKDMKRTVAEVDISKTEAFRSEFKENSKYFDSIGATEVIKRELITYFVTVGYSYVQNYGWSYEQTFNTLVDGLVQNAILTQYATMYLLQEKAAEDANAFETFSSLSGGDHKEYEKYEYLLGAESDDVKLAKYTLMYSINSAVDSIEKDRILKYSESSTGSDTRTAPGNVDAQQDDYYPKKKNASGQYVRPDDTVINDGDADKNYVLDYGVYTGYTTLANSGAYLADRDDFLAKNGTTATRVRAYTEFVSGLISYNLVDEKKEDITAVETLEYYADEYVSQLKSRVINKYYDLYEEEQIKKLVEEGDTSYLDTAYTSLFNLQKNSYKTEAEFSTAIGSMSDTSFILYAPEAENGGTFGFVYNILLPYSASQSAQLTALQTQYKDDKVDSGYSSKYYENRNQILKNIKTTDQRRAWFDGSEEYAFEAEGKVEEYYGDSGWLFFENNLTNNDRYKPLDKYVGKYAYNGNVIKNKDGKYIFGNPVQLGIDDMLKEFTGYVNYVLNGYDKAVTTNHVTFDAGYNSSTWENTSGYYDTTDFYTGEKNDDKQDQIDYSKLVYASGKVNFTADRANALNPDKNNAQYWANAAVNELQYAYTTDTGVLSQYLGYTVEAGDTSYIKEFEYAAHQAVNNGEGAFTVCAGDYGWHLIYVTYCFDIEDGGNGALYQPKWVENITTEGTFENKFYEWIKDNDIDEVSSTRQTQIINRYNKDKVTVKKYEKAYKNLTNLG